MKPSEEIMDALYGSDENLRLPWQCECAEDCNFDFFGHFPDDIPAEQFSTKPLAQRMDLRR